MHFVFVCNPVLLFQNQVIMYDRSMLKAILASVIGVVNHGKPDNTPYITTYIVT